MKALVAVVAFAAVLAFAACNGGGDAGDDGGDVVNGGDAPVTTGGQISIALGQDYSCAVTAEGRLKCWGWNLTGNIGDGTNVNRAAPVDVVGQTNDVVGVAADAHTCAVTASGGVKCWGSGLLGDGPLSNSTTPVEVIGLSSGAAAVAVGGTHTCVLTTAGGVKCWGSNIYGEVGVETSEECMGTPCTSAPVDVVGLESDVVAIALGDGHTCVLTEEGGVKCWGKNSRGQLGDSTTTKSTSPVDVVGLENGVAAIAAAGDFTCAVTTSGMAKCWGANQFGQLGDGTTTDRDSAVDVAGLETSVTAIGAGGSHACAVTEDGGVKCWGLNSAGQLGSASSGTCAAPGSLTDPPCSTTPADVSGLTDEVTTIAAGSRHTCAATTEGNVECWGENTFGQLGDGMTAGSRVPVRVLLDGPADDTTANGDDAELTAYFGKVVLVTVNYANKTSELVKLHEANLSLATSDAETIQEYQSLVSVRTTFIARGFDDIGRIEPPASVADAHNALKSALLEQLAIFVDFDEAIAGVASVPELDETLAEFDAVATEAEQRVVDACTELQDVADDNGIDVDLRCEGLAAATE